MLALVIANLKMMVRDRQTLFWALVFPLTFVIVFGLFDFESSSTADLAIIDQANSEGSKALIGRLYETAHLKVDAGYANRIDAQEALGDGDLENLLIILERCRYSLRRVGLLRGKWHAHIAASIPGHRQ